jgi:hypothetical protein
MLSTPRILGILLWLPAAIACAETVPPPAPDTAGIAFFEKNVRPLLSEHCLECHSVRTGKRKGGLLLDSRDGIAQGGDSGPALLPGNPDQSRLVSAVRGHDPDLRMPPKKPLAPADAEILAEWVRLGAPDPRTAVANPRQTYGMSLSPLPPPQRAPPRKRPATPSTGSSSQKSPRPDCNPRPRQTNER